MEQFVNFVIRPQRADYIPKNDLLDQDFTLKGQWFRRKDLEITNSRGVVLKCSHYIPLVIPEGTALPCVIYCHGNSGCRADASEAAIILLPSYITVFTFDFSGSGLSGGEHVTLGWNEKDDLKAVVDYLRSDENVSRIGLWGRSMGAVTSLMYGAEDPSIAGMALDSPFSDLVDLMNELVDTYKFCLPKFTVKYAIQYMRKVIQKKAKFDIMDLNTIKVAKSCFVPVLIGHAIDDDFIQSHHSERVYDAYVGDKNIIKFEGDHNSPRPQFYFDSITIFFHNVLHPPKDAVEGNYFDTMHDYCEKGSWDTTNEIGYTNHSFMGASKGLVTRSTEDAINELRSKRPMSRMEMFMEAMIESLKDLEIRQRHEEEQLSNMRTNSPESSWTEDPDYAENCGPSMTDGCSTSGTNTHDLTCELPSPGMNISSKGPTFDTPSFMESGSNGTSTHNDRSVSIKNSSNGDRSTQDADMVDGTRATLTVQRNPTGYIMNGLKHRWGLNFFRNSS